MSFEDVAAESTILAGILRHGQDAFIDVDDFIDPDMMSQDVNKVILSCIKDHFGAGETRPLDLATLLSIANRKGVGHVLDQEDERRHIRALYKFPVDLETVRPEAAKLAKLDYGRRLDELLRQGRKDLHKITGDESLATIFALIEDPLAELSASLDNADSDGPIQIAEGGEEWLEHVIANPRQFIGIPTPYSEYNKQIGGGFRPSTVSLIGARMKVGKTILSDNIGLHVAGKLNIPVFNLDTEMTHTEHLARILANISGVPSDIIETGMFENDEQTEAAREAMRWLKTIPYYYEPVVNKSFDAQMAGIRRWATKYVPLDENGNRTPALIIYDYLQMSDATEFKQSFSETQMLGFHMMSLLRIAAKMSLSMLSLIQLNRDGDQQESSTVISGSDRPAMKCANFTIFKHKSEAEISDDGIENGTHKLINQFSRHGAGGKGNYISLHFDGACSRIDEGKTFNQIRSEKGPRKTSNEQTFDVSKKRNHKPKAVAQESGPADYPF